MKKNFKLISLLTVVTVLVNVLSVLVLLKPASAMTSAKGTFFRLKANTATDNIVVDFPGATGAVVVTFPADWTGTGATATPNCLAANPGVHTFSCNAGVTSVVVTGLINPAAVDNYRFSVAEASANTINVEVPIVDSDRVDVTGYITSAMYFDLDTNTDNTHCTNVACVNYNGNGVTTGNYTVDLGELTLATLSRSGDDATHATGNGDKTGEINYIYFDLSTNAVGGAVVTMVSVGTRPGYLDGPGTLTEDIPSVADGTTMTAGTAGYGYRWYATPTNQGFGTGNTEWIDTDCNLAATGQYCAIPTTSTAIWSSTKSAQEVRGYLQLGAAINGTMVPGTYNDVLQFIATATY